MSHELDFTDSGEARFAYNANGGDPWHRLGVSVQGFQTLDAMLMAAQADFPIIPVRLQAVLEDGTTIDVETHKATARQIVTLGDTDFETRTDLLGVVGIDYAIEGNREAAEWAVECVGAADGDAVIDTMGVMKGGREFFTCIDMGSLVLDPNGIADRIKRYFVVLTGHDGRRSLSGYPTNTRVVCNNTATWSYEAASRARQVHTVRHTRNKDVYKAEAVKAMALQRKLAGLFEEQAMAMIATPATRATLDDTVKHLWPRSKDFSDRQVTNWQERRSTLMALYSGDTCSGQYGHNAWSVWNAVTEYLDHHRKGKAEARALATANPDGEVAKMKDKAAQYLLASV